MQITLKIDFDDRINLNAYQNAVRKKWNKAVSKAAPKLERDLKESVTKSKFLTAFTDTKLWRFLHTKEALAELGFTSLKPLYEDLLPALKKTIICVADSRGTLAIRMINMDIVARMTIHRSAGTGKLGEVSWFVDWIINGEPVQSYQFERTGPPRPRSSRISGAEAGLMIQSLGGGFWQFPPIYKGELDMWLLNNINSIKALAGMRIMEGINPTRSKAMFKKFNMEA